MLIDVTISSGTNLSGSVDVSKGRIVAIACPVLTSGDLLIRGSLDNSAFLDMRSRVSSNDTRFATGLGSAMVLWDSTLFSPPFIKLQTGVNQAAPRTFTVLTRPWGI